MEDLSATIARVDIAVEALGWVSSGRDRQILNKPEVWKSFAIAVTEADGTTVRKELAASLKGVPPNRIYRHLTGWLSQDAIALLAENLWDRRADFYKGLLPEDLQSIVEMAREMTPGDREAFLSELTIDERSQVDKALGLNPNPEREHIGTQGPQEATLNSFQERSHIPERNCSKCGDRFTPNPRLEDGYCDDCREYLMSQNYKPTYSPVSEFSPGGSVIADRKIIRPMIVNLNRSPEWLHPSKKSQMEYVGRFNRKNQLERSPLANQWKMTRESDRDRACDEDIERLIRVLSVQKGTSWDELSKLAERVKKGDEIGLACWCHPKRCHADAIALVVEGLARDKSTEEIIKGLRGLQPEQQRTLLEV